MGTHVWFASIHLPKAGVSDPERQKKQVWVCLRETRSVSVPERENSERRERTATCQRAWERDERETRERRGRDERETRDRRERDERELLQRPK
jgi:hypothetical protein